MNKISCVTTQHERMSLSCRTCYVISKYMLYTCHCATKTIPRYSIFINRTKISVNYLMLHGLLLIRGNSPCNLCKKTEDGIHHILFNCASLEQTRAFVQRCLQQIGVNNFNQFNIIGMTGMKDMPNYIISLYKDTIWKNRRSSFSRKINDESVIKSIDYNIFYVNHII